MFNKLIKKVIESKGYQLVKSKPLFPPDFDQLSLKIIAKVSEFTATSPERFFAFHEAVKYIIKNNVEGDIVECGVYKGGSMMTMAYTLMSMNETGKGLYLYDTFEGMSYPEDIDRDFQGRTALQQLKDTKRQLDE